MTAAVVSDISDVFIVNPSAGRRLEFLAQVNRPSAMSCYASIDLLPCPAECRRIAGI